jgi:hypothetical protein
MRKVNVELLLREGGLEGINIFRDYRNLDSINGARTRV